MVHYIFFNGFLCFFAFVSLVCLLGFFDGPGGLIYQDQREIIYDKTVFLATFFAKLGVLGG